MWPGATQNGVNLDAFSVQALFTTFFTSQVGFDKNIHL